MTARTRNRSLLAFAFALSFLCPPPAMAQQSLLSDLQAVRAHYPTSNLSPAQLGELLNQVAWMNKADGWGLLSKPGGNNCPTPAGVKVSCDFLVHLPSGLGFDVLSDSEGAARVNWGEGSPVDRGFFVAPVHPGTEPTDPPQPPVPPVDPAPDNGPAIQRLLSQQILILEKISQQLEILTGAETRSSAAVEAAVKDLKAEIARGIRVRF